MNEAQQPTCWIIAGPNGAGKTTFALTYLPEVAQCRRFINADLIAAGMAPLEPDSERLAAGRIFLRELERHVEARCDFGFETTLSGRSYMKLIQRLRAAGWRVELIYLALPSPEIARLRVAERVRHGGHDIPAVDIERRFTRSLENLLHHYVSLVDRCVCFLNTGAVPRLVFTQAGEQRQVAEPEIMAMLEAWRKA